MKPILKMLDRIKPPRWALRVEKRIRFVMSALILTGIMLFSTLFVDMALLQKSLIFIPIFIGAVYFLTFFSVLEGIEGVEWFTLFIMPLLLTIAMFFFYNLIPIRWLTRIPFIVSYAISIYAVLLTSNIFNVGAEKNLQLYRAAFSVNYFYQTFVIFLLCNTLLSLSENFGINALGSALITIPLSLQFFWSIKLNVHLERTQLLFVFLLSLLVAESALIFSFIPFAKSIFALLLTVMYYSIAGLIYAHLDQRLFKETVREYLVVLGVVLIIGALSVKW